MAVRIKEAVRRITPKQAALFGTSVLCLLLFLFVTLWINSKLAKLPDQNGAKRWDPEGGAAQVSCFLAEGTELDQFQIQGFEHQLEQMLKEVLPGEELPGQNRDQSQNQVQNQNQGKQPAQIQNQEPKQGKRLFIDAYSGMGSVTISSERGEMTNVMAVGAGGDFFLFHPLSLVSGAYFSGNDLMQDSVVLDQEAAWQLFGSFDIAGMCVMIGGVPHYVSGVVKRPEGRMEKGAGLTGSLVFLSYDSLAKYGQNVRISTYEVIAPNPVKNYLSTAVKEHLGIPQEDMAVVENSARYGLENMIPVLLDFGTRSMQNAAIHFPYWENLARGWEDIRGLVLLVQFVLLLVPAVIGTGFIVYKWRHRSFTGKDIVNRIVDFKDKWRYF